MNVNGFSVCAGTPDVLRLLTRAVPHVAQQNRDREGAEHDVFIHGHNLPSR